MKKTLLLVLLLIICLGFLFLYNGNKKSTIDTSDRDFTVENVDDIAKILIVPRNLPPTTLTKNNNGKWIYNDSIVVRDDAIRNLTDVFQYLRIKFIPTSAAIKNIKEEMAEIGIKVNLYNASNKLMKSYYIGGSPPDERGTYLMMDGAEQPYTMEMPHMEGSVRGRFLLRPMEWKDRTLIKENFDDIVQVSIEYPKDQKQSFVLSREGDGFSVSPMDNQVVGAKKKANYGNARAFIESFELVPGEYVENDNIHRDSISALIPFSKISYTLKSGVTKKISMHPVMERLPEDTKVNKLASINVIMRFFANTSWNDFILVQQRQLKNTHVGYSYFIEK